MTESKAKEILVSIKDDNNFGGSIPEVLDMAIKAIEKVEKIKEAFEKWKNDTSGFYGADDEATHLISALKKILRSNGE